ncbi:hypothetical protein EES39_19785 [Streptomyces sp. ADI92-24]|nr:hypothetical protein EES39_19785 [Streptomyces sp. ADI92-24]
MPSLTVSRTGPAPEANASRDAASSVRSAPSATARWSRAARVVARAWPVAASASSGTVARWLSRRAAWALSASGVLADSGQATGPDVVPAGSGASCGVAAGGSSMITWALVPLIPNDDTPARRGRPCAGQAVGPVSRATAPESQSTWGDGSSACRVAGRVPWRIAWTILMTPATPAAAWVWPMLDLMEPSSSGLPSAGRSWP